MGYGGRHAVTVANWPAAVATNQRRSFTLSAGEVDSPPERLTSPEQGWSGRSRIRVRRVFDVFTVIGRRVPERRLPRQDGAEQDGDDIRSSEPPDRKRSDRKRRERKREHERRVFERDVRRGDAINLAALSRTSPAVSLCRRISIPVARF